MTVDDMLVGLMAHKALNSGDAEVVIQHYGVFLNVETTKTQQLLKSDVNLSEDEIEETYFVIFHGE